MNEKPEKIRAPNEESFKLSDVWDQFKIRYLPFVEWTADPDEKGLLFAVLEFIEDQPTAYKNKWNRDQFKIEVQQYDERKVLSAGKRLFSIIAQKCLDEMKMPSAFGEVTIHRWGSGFDIDYSITLKNNVLAKKTTSRK